MQAGSSARDARSFFPPNSQKQTHTIVIRSDEPVAVNVDLHGRAFLNFKSELRRRGFQRAFALSGQLVLNQVLDVMLESLLPEPLARNVYVSRVSLTYIAEETGHFRGSVGRSIKELVAHGLVVIEHRGTHYRDLSLYRLRIPPEPFHKKRVKNAAIKPETVAPGSTALLRRHVQYCCTGTDSTVAPARTALYAPAQQSGGDTTDSSVVVVDNTTTTTTSLAWTEQLKAVVVDGLEGLEIGPEKIEELLGLPTTSPIVAIAAIYFASKRPPQHRSGMAIKCLQELGRIPEAARRYAARKIAAMNRSSPAASPEMAVEDPDQRLTPAMIAELKNKIVEARNAS